MKRILIAGIGNIFLGDDAFGCEVIQQLSCHELPDSVEVIDFGIRSYDLAYALTGDFDAVVLVDIASRGELPGTTFLLEIDPAQAETGEAAYDPHRMSALSAIQMAQSLGGIRAKLYLVGCEPAVLESEAWEMNLSKTAREAIPQALDLIESLVTNLANREKIEDVHMTEA